MIAEQERTKDFYEQAKKKMKNKSANLELLEKTTNALSLVECLVIEGLNFIFKGGTSLTILLDDIKRFSIDVDIITEESKERTRELINLIISHQNLFYKVEENIRNNATSKMMDIEHYKFYYISKITGKENNILLDIAYEKNVYPEIVSSKIELDKFDIYSDTYVKTPSIESILGDKLTVLATNSVGIHYGTEKELELMKQLYDVDKLFNQVERVDIVIKSFVGTSNKELKYRKQVELTYKDVLEDIREFCDDVIIPEREHDSEISRGLRKIAGYVLESNFSRDQKALTAASKVLYLTKIIESGENDIERYHEGCQFENKEIPNKYKTRMKKMRVYNEEAYYYMLKGI